MGEAADAEMGPEEVADLLGEVDGYERTLTARTAGLTALVWGTAIPGLFVTYNAAGHWVMDHGAPEWVFAVLWLPWIAAASLTSNWLWRLNAVTLERERGGGSGWPTSLGFTLLFFLVAALVWGLLALAGVDVGTNGWMVLATGAFTLVLGGLHGYRGWVGARETSLAGLAILAGGLPIALAPASLAPDVAFGFASAGLVGLAYFAAGIALFVRG